MSVATQFPWPEKAKPEAALHQIWERAPVGMACCTRRGIISDMNPALERMLGGAPGEFISMPLSVLIQPDAPGDNEKLFSELANGQWHDLHIEQKRVRPDGKNGWMRWIVWPVAADDGQLDHALVLAEEVTTSPRDEQRLSQSRKMEAVGRLVGGVAHDFNNLLTGVTLYCDLLLASLEPAHRLRQYVEEIRAAGTQAAGLIRQLLALAGPQDTEPCALSLNGIVDAMGNLLTRLIGENIALTFHLDPDLGEVKMDPAQAQQILLNLVLNARDALPEGGQISVETRNAKASAQVHESSAACEILLMVSDNGRGMDAETQTHLFEPFFTTKAAGKGNGLGLTTVYNIVDRNGGRIHVDSVPGRGTSVTVRLPQFSARQVSGALSESARENDLHLTYERGGTTQRETKESTP